MNVLTYYAVGGYVMTNGFGGPSAICTDACDECVWNGIIVKRPNKPSANIVVKNIFFMVFPPFLLFGILSYYL